MKIRHLTHRHGGTITDLFAIRHGLTRRGQAEWFFIGRVEWSDGSTSERVEIYPICVCRDDENPEANAESDAVFAKLTEYLNARGEWVARGSGWAPRTPTGELEL